MIYYWVTAEDQIFLLTVYGKGEKEDLSTRAGAFAAARRRQTAAGGDRCVQSGHGEAEPQGVQETPPG